MQALQQHGMKIILSLMPVLLFLTGLFLMDSFKLVRKPLLFLALAWGMMAAGLAYFFNEFITNTFQLDYTYFTRYVAPFAEEILKSLLIFVLLSRKKIGFSVDAAIYGFASGAGFSLVENVVYMHFLGDEPNIMLWLMRGFGTAVMHGGCTAILAMWLMGGIQREKNITLTLLTGLLMVFIIHSLFNHFLLNPFLQTLLIFLVLPVIFTYVFQQSNQRLKDWLEMEFSNEVELLKMIRQGRLSDTRAGLYLASLRDHYEPAMMVDILNYMALYLDLSIKAKRNLMLKEHDLPLLQEPDTADKLLELNTLRRLIGKTGELSLQPLIRMQYRDLWKLNTLI